MVEGASSRKSSLPAPYQTRLTVSSLTTTDVTSKKDLEALVAEVSKREKHIDLLGDPPSPLNLSRLPTDNQYPVANAGIAGPKAEPDEKNADELREKLWNNESFSGWDDTFRTDVTGVYFTTVAFLPLLQAAIKPSGNASPFGPSVIVISSMSGIMRHAQGHFAYNAAKGATVHLTKLMSAEFQKAGVRVNSIAPGYFPSEMTTKDSDERQKSDLPPEKVADKGHVPLERGGTDIEMGMTAVSGDSLKLSGKLQKTLTLAAAIPREERVRERTDIGRRWRRLECRGWRIVLMCRGHKRSILKITRLTSQSRK